MITRDKRTRTEPGLGRATGDPRSGLAKRSTSAPPPPLGAEAKRRSEKPPAPSAPPISAPPSAPGSGAPPSARHHTKALEPQRRPSRETETPMTPAPPPSIPRAPESVRALSRDEDGPHQGGLEETPFDRVERTERIERLERIERIRRAPTLREDGGASDARSETPRAPGVGSSPPSSPASRRSQRPIEGRPVTSPPNSRAPMSSKPPRASTRPPKPTDPPATADAVRAVPHRPAKSQRASIRVDEVGSVTQDAVSGGARSSRQIPKILKTKDEIAAAPIDNRAGFLLAYIDGTTTVQGLVDMAVMPEQEVHEILERLRRLAIIALR